MFLKRDGKYFPKRNDTGTGPSFRTVPDPSSLLYLGEIEVEDVLGAGTLAAPAGGSAAAV